MKSDVTGQSYNYTNSIIIVNISYCLEMSLPKTMDKSCQKHADADIYTELNK